MMVQLTIKGEPVPWARARLNGKRHFLPPKAAQYKNALGHVAKIAMKGREPLTGAVVIDVQAFLSVPRSWAKGKRERALQGLIRPAVKPDWDNLGKNVGDALNKIAYNDDAQIVDGRVRLWYAEEPSMSVEVKPWTGQT